MSFFLDIFCRARIRKKRKHLVHQIRKRKSTDDIYTDPSDGVGMALLIKLWTMELNYIKLRKMGLHQAGWGQLYWKALKAGTPSDAVGILSWRSWQNSDFTRCSHRAGRVVTTHHLTKFLTEGLNARHVNGEITAMIEIRKCHKYGISGRDINEVPAHSEVAAGQQCGGHKYCGNQHKSERDTHGAFRHHTVLNTSGGFVPK